MLNIHPSIKASQSPHSSDAEVTPQTAGISPTDCTTTLPLSDFFAWAVEQNKAYYASRQKARRYASPLFKLAQCLKSHPDLKGCTAKDAFTRVTTEVKSNWATLFPHVPLPDLEFITAWDQINIPTGASPLALIEDSVLNEPLTLLETPACEGYEYYLGIAFHLQRLAPRSDILLPVGILSGLLTKLIGKAVSEQSISNYCRKAKQDDYIKLMAKAHHPSGAAARYRFDLKRFTETGVELDPNSKKCQLADATFSHDSHGSEGTHGIEGSDGSEVGSCVLSHAYHKEQTSSKSSHEEDKEENLENIEGGKVLEEKADTSLASVNSGKKKNKVTEISLSSAWLSPGTSVPESRSQTGNKPKPKENVRGHSLAVLWQERLSTLEPDKYHKPLTQDECGMLGHVGKYVGNDAGAVIEFVLGHWSGFVKTAMTDHGLFGSQPETPGVPFFVKYHDSAVNMMLQALAQEKAHAEQEAKWAESHAKIKKQQADAKACPRPEKEKPYKPSQEEIYETLKSFES